VDQGGDGVDSSVVGAGPELCHGEQGMSLNLDIYSLGYDFFHQLASAL